MVGQLPSLFSFFVKNTYSQATSRGRAADRARGGGVRAIGQYAGRDVVAVADARQRGVSTTLLTGGMNAPRRQRGGASVSYLVGGSLCSDLDTPLGGFTSAPGAEVNPGARPPLS